MNKTEELEEIVNASHRACRALREDIVEGLSENVCEVNFNKVDGSVRKMFCTLDPRIMNVDSDGAVTKAKSKEVNLDIVKCFDIEAQGWRSFRVESVIDWSIPHLQMPFNVASENK
jgi:hypothetical protein